MRPISRIFSAKKNSSEPKSCRDKVQNVDDSPYSQNSDFGRVNQFFLQPRLVLEFSLVRIYLDDG